MIKIYLKDWYYNAGIIGFIYVLSEGKRQIDDIKNMFNQGLKIGENFLEFDPNILNGFYEKYIKLAFDIFFDLDNYKERFHKLMSKITSENAKITKTLLQETALGGKIVNNFITALGYQDLNNIFKEKTKDEILKIVKDILDKLNTFNSSADIYSYLLNINGTNFISYFLDNEISKRICSYNNITDYITKIKELKITDNHKKCFICGEFKKEYDFSNAITQILGFNSDNSNWIWGFNTSKAKICPVCALIYSCALHGMIFINRRIDKDYKTFFYTINRNTDIATLYHSFQLFKEKLAQEENQDKPFYTILQEVAIELINNRAQAVAENINFIEIEENQFGGQSTKGYNIYNYNISKELAKFLKHTTDTEGIPTGFYKERDMYFDITEEILKKSLDYSLGFSDIYRYFEYFIRSLDPKSKILVKYSIFKICKYILKYIFMTKGGNIMDITTQEKIVNKAFYHGKDLAKKMNQENKIKGIVYQLLNDLKIGDRNAFMDKYLRLCMAYEAEVKLGSNNELTDMDNFMSFGYSFVNGLLNNLNNNNTEEV